MRQDAPFFQEPPGRKIIVPRADHAIRWAMQPGALASRNRASAASSSTHPRPLRGLPEKGSPFLCLIPLPPFFAVLGHPMRRRHRLCNRPGCGTIKP